MKSRRVMSLEVFREAWRESGSPLPLGERRKSHGIESVPNYAPVGILHGRSLGQTKRPYLGIIEMAENKSICLYLYFSNANGGGDGL